MSTMDELRLQGCRSAQHRLENELRELRATEPQDRNITAVATASRRLRIVIDERKRLEKLLCV